MTEREQAEAFSGVLDMLGRGWALDVERWPHGIEYRFRRYRADSGWILGSGPSVPIAAAAAEKAERRAELKHTGGTDDTGGTTGDGEGQDTSGDAGLQAAGVADDAAGTAG